MANGFSNQPIEVKPYGFLPQRLGKRVVYCNRYAPNSLWYERVGDKNIDMAMPDGEPALSFVSKPGGLVSLKAYAAERYGEIKWKIGLSLRGPLDQIFQFEAGLGTIFCHGMLWGLCAANEADLKGEIGIVPTPADPTKVKSKNVGKILYCNIFVNGEEMPYFPGGVDFDWVELLTIAMTKCNGYAPDPAELPVNGNFMDEEKAEKYRQEYGDRASSKTAPKQSQFSRPIAQTATGSGATYGYAPDPAELPVNGNFMDEETAPKQSQFSRPIVQTATRSGVTYPNTPTKAEVAEVSDETIARQAEMKADLDRSSADQLEHQGRLNALNDGYNDFLKDLEAWYKTNGLEIDRERLDKVVSRAGVTSFEELSIHRKHQIVVTLSKELLIEKCPGHKAIDQLVNIMMPNPFTSEAFQQLAAITESAFAELVPF